MPSAPHADFDLILRLLNGNGFYLGGQHFLRRKGRQKPC